jgi:hypothetical protein
MTKTAKITFKKAPAAEHEYALARFDVFADGEKIGQVEQVEAETCRTMASGIRYDVRPTTRWALVGHRNFLQHRSRKAAGEDLVRRIAR